MRVAGGGYPREARGRGRSRGPKRGSAVAITVVMGWRHFTEIEAWQLSMRLDTAFDAVLSRPPACLDRDFCVDARDALASAPRNIAEGFGRYNTRDFANFVRMAKASLFETQTNLHLARNRGYLTTGEFEPLWALSEQAVRTTTGLLKSLLRRPPKR
jgi:four helix bundle protein